jgi:hypothetical protein
VISIGVGSLIGLGNILGMIGVGAADASGSIIPEIATHTAVVLEHVNGF